MGVSGSGKTSVGRLLSEELGWKYYEGDDFDPSANIEKMRSGIPLDAGDRRSWLETLRGLIRNCLERGDSAVLACSARPSALDFFYSPSVPAQQPSQICDARFGRAIT